MAAPDRKRKAVNKRPGLAAKEKRRTSQPKIEKELRQRLAEAEDTLRAIRSGEVDAVVVSGPRGEQIFTLKGAEHPYRIFLETMNEGALTLMADGMIVYSNQRFARMLQEPSERVMGATLDAFVAPDHRQRLHSLIAQSLAGEARGEILFRRFDGADMWADLSLCQTKLGDATGISVIATDITERKSAEDRIKELNATLEYRVADLTVANKELEAFSYSVSHDLRAPLRAIDGFSQALLEDYGGTLDAGANELLLRVRAASERMDRLIQGLLFLSGTARGEIQRTTVDLTCLAQDIAQELQKANPGRQVECAAAAGLVANADANLLRIVMENLLGNAWKFTAKHRSGRVEVGEARRDGEIVYWVRDDGAGFNMAYADRLFSPFQRLHTVQQFEGTGVGLATVQRIVHRHGGRIWADGQVEAGATFYFTLAAAAR